MFRSFYYNYYRKIMGLPIVYPGGLSQLHRKDGYKNVLEKSSEKFHLGELFR